MWRESIAGLRPATVAYYQDHISRALLGWADLQGYRSLEELTPAALSRWLVYEASRTYQRRPTSPVRTISRTTIQNRQAAARRFFAWTVAQGYLPSSPMASVASWRADEPERRAFTRQEVGQLVKESGNAYGWLGKRDRAIVYTLLGTGIRVGALLALRWRDVDQDAKQLSILTKGGKRQTVPAGSKTLKALRDYRLTAPPSPPGVDTIWLTMRRTAMSYGAVAAALENLGKYAGVEGVIPHRFRHTFTVEHYLRHRDIRALQHLLGHSKIATTETYLRTLGVDYALSAGLQSPDEWLG